VSCLQYIEQAKTDASYLRDGKRALGGDHLGHAFAEQRFHDDPVPAVLGHDVVDRDGSPWLTVAAAQASIKRRPGAPG
jgi:hypothetical protein